MENNQLFDQDIKFMYISAIKNYDPNEILKLLEADKDSDVILLIEKYVRKIKNGEFVWVNDILSNEDNNNLQQLYIACYVVRFSGKNLLYEAAKDAILYLKDGIYPYTEDIIRGLSNHDIMSLFMSTYT